MATVFFYCADISSISLNNKNKLKRLIIELFSEEGKNLRELNYIFCSDHYLLGINRKFLRHDFYTDVISFNLSEGEAIIGEIYISAERVKENARTNFSTVNNEFRRVIIHGALHLCGYKDKKKSEKTEMRMKEDYYLQLFEGKSN